MSNKLDRDSVVSHCSTASDVVHAWMPFVFSFLAMWFIGLPLHLLVGGYIGFRNWWFEMDRLWRSVERQDSTDRRHSLTIAIDPTGER